MQTMYPRSISTRFTLLTVIVFVVSMWTLVAYAIHVLRDDMQRSIGQQLLDTVTLMANEIDADLQERTELLNTLASSLGSQDLATHQALQATLDLHTEIPQHFNFGAFVTDLRGVAIASVPVSLERLGVVYADRDYMQTTLGEGKSAISKPVTGKKTKTAVIAMSSPVRNGQGKTIGALVGVVDLQRPSFLDRIAAHTYGETGGYLLIDRSNRIIITATDQTRIMESLPPHGVNALLDRHVAGKDGIDIAINPKGVAVITATRALHSANWYVVVSLPIEEAFSPIVALEQRIWVGAILATLIAAALVWWSAHSLIRPLVQATGALKLASESGKPLPPLAVTSNDEIGYLLGAFNHLLQNLQQREQDVLRLAWFDHLTGLPNRRLFLDRLERAVATHIRTRHHGAVIYLDLDKFKQINDTYGHAAGDALLIEAAQRLQGALRESDTVARLGGDEMVVLLNDCAADATEARANALASAEKLRERLAQTYTLKAYDVAHETETIRFDCSASMGVCIFCDAAITPSEILKRADEAMYAAKQAGGNAVRLYSAV